MSVVVFYANIWGNSIYILDEAKNATCAREMLHRGDIIVPTFNDELRTDKPPLHYYFMMLSYTLFGEANPFSARFFSALMGVFTVMLVFIVGKRELGERSAFYGSLVMLAALQPPLQFHLAVPDPYLIFLVTAATFYLYRFNRTEKWLHFTIGYGAVGFGVLVKGPVAIVLPGLSIFVYLILSKQLKWSAIWRMRPMLGALLILIIAVPWYFMVYKATDGKWIEAFFFKHNIGRYTSTMEGHGGVPLLAIPVALLSLLPFSTFIIQVLRNAWKRRNENPLINLALAAGCSTVLFFSFSQTILPSYISPALPFLSLLFGYYFDQLVTNYSASLKGVKSSVLVFTFIAMSLPVAGYLAMKNDQSIADLKELSLWLLVFSFGAIAAMIFVFKKDYKRMFMSLVISGLLWFQVFNYLIFPKLDAKNPVLASKDFWQKKEMYYYGRMNASFVFNAQKIIPPISSTADLQRLKQGPESFIIITRKDQATDLLKDQDLQLVFQQKDLFENHTTMIFEFKN